MKRALITLSLCIATTILFAQKKEWKQLEDFHGIISKTYHPAEEGNLKPIREKADSLVQRAMQWQDSPIPAGYNAKMVKPKLATLVTQCKAVSEAVKENKNDETVKKLISAAHTTFHGIMEKGED